MLKAFTGIMDSSIAHYKLQICKTNYYLYVENNTQLFPFASKRVYIRNKNEKWTVKLMNQSMLIWVALNVFYRAAIYKNQKIIFF